MRFLLFIFCGYFFSVGCLAQGNPAARRKVVQTTKSDLTKGAEKRTRSKIVNDSVKNIYGPKTTLSTTEAEIFENKKSYVPLDTSIYNIHRWDFVKKYENKYQDLGNLGTALNPIFPTLPNTIGATSGFKVYDLYYESAEPRHYDTKSPFSRINIIWGGRGRSKTHVEFTRNIHSRWNFGINYRPILSAAQIAYSGNRLYQVTSQYYDFYTSYTSKNSKYKLLLSYRRIKHHVKENGGIHLTTDSTYRAYFNPNSSANLTISAGSPPTAFTDELRNQLHLFQHYQFGKAAQFYQKLDITKQINTFQIGNTSNALTEATTFFGQTYTDTTEQRILRGTVQTQLNINDVNTFKTFQNEFGFKGNAAFLFYDFYYKLRSYNNNMNNLYGQAPSAIGIEHYVGSKITLRYDSLSFLSGQAEYLLDGHYKIDGQLRTPWLDADLRSSLAKPGFMQQAYRGGFNAWTNIFKNVFSNQLSGRIKVNAGPLYFSPGLSYTVFHNYVYFTDSVLNHPIGQKAVAQQSLGNQQIVSTNVNLGVRFFKKFHLRPEVIYTKILNNDDGAISIPDWFSNVQLSYENVIFNGALQLQVGFDANYKSAYKALGYDPAIQQFYLQQSKQSIISTPFWSTDFFLNGRIKRGRFFFKYLNLVQLVTGQGYLPTPGYPNVKSTFDFGFELILFE